MKIFQFYEWILEKRVTVLFMKIFACFFDGVMATHSSILAWRIPWTEEPGGLQSTGSQRVGHDWATSLHFIENVTIWYSSRLSSTSIFYSFLFLSSIHFMDMSQFVYTFTYQWIFELFSVEVITHNLLWTVMYKPLWEEMFKYFG